MARTVRDTGHFIALGVAQRGIHFGLYPSGGDGFGERNGQRERASVICEPKLSLPAYLRHAHVEREISIELRYGYANTMIQSTEDWGLRNFKGARDGKV